ncbi:MAG: ATP-grasp domain-containing protein [Promethearchaeota archaeon]
MIKNKIFIFEFLSGGGFQVNIPYSLFCEAYGMLKSIITDFKEIDFEISTLLDHRISFLSSYLKADSIKIIKKEDNYLKEFKKLVKKCDFSFIIAPEFSNILYDLTKIVRDNKKKILSIGLEGIRLGSSKIKTYNFFKNNNIFTPQTYLIPIRNNSLDLDFIIRKFNQLNSSIIIKPEDGVGAESIYYFETQYQIKKFFHESNVNIDLKRNFILQEYVKGKDLSVSLIGFINKLNAHDSYPLILSINSQDINFKNLKEDSEYLGGYTPIRNNEKIAEQLAEILQKLDLSMFNGYYGIDFLRKIDKSIYFIEINPRLTTSYIGIRNIIDKNIAELIFNSKFKFPNSRDLKIRNNSIFSKIELNYIGNKNFNKIREEIIPKLANKIPELVTPPIPFNNSPQNNNTRYSCFIATKEKNLESSRKKVTKIIEIFKNADFKIN